MIAMDILKLYERPICRRCQKPVEKVEVVAITGGTEITYECHGESKTHEVAAWMCDEMERDGKPFVAQEFQNVAPEPVPALDEKDRTIAELRAENERLKEELKSNAIPAVS